ncbi:transmembrane protein 240-like [Chelmon rostratus]|uniref:transmembrane protein 240-like n=1 Tax=Chelmon rostratus TaxID=109905 RepID=UPI001BE913D4|nr:transmembrane protein 240-like [Chelmon rostratus]
MNALFHRFHNFILPLVRGKERVCACTCGRHQVYYVIPYNEAQSKMASRENNVLSDIMTQQEMGLIVGLLLGLCISWFLLLLDRVWFSGLNYWRANQMHDVGFWSQMPKFSNTKDFFRWLLPKHTEDSSGNMVHIKQDVYHNVNGSI